MNMRLQGMICLGILTYSFYIRCITLYFIAILYATFAFLLIQQDEKVEEMRDEELFFQSSKQGDSLLSEHVVMN